jgi:hypothetical protein
MILLPARPFARAMLHEPDGSSGHKGVPGMQQKRGGP